MKEMGEKKKMGSYSQQSPSIKNVSFILPNLLTTTATADSMYI
jgi:hypothetical protein